MGTNGWILREDFNQPLDSGIWDFNHFSAVNNPSFLGRTQQRQTLPTTSNGYLQLQLDTYAPPPPDGQPPTPVFLGSEAITTQLFMPTTPAGIAFEARMRLDTSAGGIVGGMFPYAVYSPQRHDEADFELLSNRTSQTGNSSVQTNIYRNEGFGAGAPVFVPVSGSLTDFHVYRIEWIPGQQDKIRWLIDGHLVRESIGDIGQSGLQLHLNIWAPAQDWAEAYKASLQPTLNPSLNTSYFVQVDYAYVFDLTMAPGGAIAGDDLYTLTKGTTLVVPASAGLLLNDANAGGSRTASVLVGPSHGALTLNGDGSFSYVPAVGFQGYDSFAYKVSNGTGGTDTAEVSLSVVPLGTGPIVTLGLRQLTFEQQVASVYVAFFGRGADYPGLAYWQHDFDIGINQLHQSLRQIYADIASNFGRSDEAKAMYPLFQHPLSATTGEIASFLSQVYTNMFNRAPDVPGLNYWTGQIQTAISRGGFVGDVLVDIIGGTQNSPAGQDITTLIGKTEIGIVYAKLNGRYNTAWTNADDQADAIALLSHVTAAPGTIISALSAAEQLVRADVGLTGTLPPFEFA